MAVKEEKIYKLTTSITASQIDNLLSSALQGCTHWADEAKLHANRFHNDTDMPEYVSEGLTKGYGLMVHEMEDDDLPNGKWHFVNLKSFLRAVEEVGSFNFDYMDMYDGDVILQTAIFGEVVYS